LTLVLFLAILVLVRADESKYEEDKKAEY